MIDSLGNTPDFVCAISIERTERIGRAAPVTLPAVQVTGGVINAKELYAWPAGEDDRIRLREVLAVLAKGGSGNLALYSRAIFVTTDASFYGFVNETKAGVSLSRTDFAMPQPASTYSLDAGGKPISLGYTGSIWVDPTTLDTLRVALRADDPPAGTDIKSVTQSVEFTHAKFGPNTVVIPVNMEFDLQERSGREQRLVSHFSDCRQYTSQRGDLFVETAFGSPVDISAVRLAARIMPASLVTAPAAAPVTRVEGPVLQPKLELQTVLTEAIDERTTVQGTRLSFTVTRDVKKKGKVIIPKGAAIGGQITRIIRQVYPITTANGFKGYYLVGMRLETVSFGSEHFQLLGNLESLGPAPLQRIDSVYFVPYSSDPNRWGTFDDMRTLFIVPKADLGESFLGVVGEFLRLPDHFVMYWTTTEPPI
jgi:hypothetical protein